jgi:apolipoprotein N-acyltransferase
MPGSSMLASVAVGEPVETPYRRIGDVFGWACVVAAAIFSLLGRGRRDLPA